MADQSGSSPTPKIGVPFEVRPYQALNGNAPLVYCVCNSSLSVLVVSSLERSDSLGLITVPSMSSTDKSLMATRLSIYINDPRAIQENLSFTNASITANVLFLT
jgi:hypothetical protein